MVWLVVTVFVWATRGSAEPVLHEPRQDHLLVIDRRVIESQSGLERFVGAPIRDARNPLLLSDQPWENATNNYYPNVTWDPEQKRWRMWYKDVLADAEAIAKMDGPSTVHNVGWYLLHAVSRDGLRWERPAAGLHRFGGSAENNIVARDCPNVGVFRDGGETDPSRRYKMVFDVGLGKPRARFSADGVNWGEVIEPKGFKSTQGDTHNNAFRDPWTGKFVWFTKMYLGERLVSRLESDDFVNWRAGGVVLRSGIDEGKSSQTYALTVFPYANGYLGYLMMYHVGTGRRVDCELAWSSDSVHWERVAAGKPLLANGPADAYDSGCIYAQAGPAVMDEGRLVLYYGGSPTVHTGWKRSGALCRATLPEDGFAGLRAGPAGGELVTSALHRTGPIRVTSEGEVRWSEESAGDGRIRLRVRAGAGACVYGIHGVELVNRGEKPVSEGLVEEVRAVRTASERLERNHLLEMWKGADVLEGLGDGLGVRVSRKAGLQPFAFGPVVVGDWPRHFGGLGVRISARVRTPEPGVRVRFEVFAKDVAQWWRETSERTGSGWSEAGVVARFGWTDAEAREAGWVRSEQGFGWRETLRNAGKVVVMPGGGFKGESFDLGEVRVDALEQ